MKTCPRCKQTLNEAEFYKKTKKTLQSFCKKCFNAYTVERWQKRKLRAIELLGGECQDCKGVFPYYVYDFHHLDASQKEFDWEKLRKRSWDAIEKELSKCVLLCSNCHRMRHGEKWET